MEMSKIYRLLNGLGDSGLAATECSDSEHSVLKKPSFFTPTYCFN